LITPIINGSIDGLNKLDTNEREYKGPYGYKMNVICLMWNIGTSTRVDKFKINNIYYACSYTDMYCSLHWNTHRNEAKRN
jgi:hypothetical protein